MFQKSHLIEGLGAVGLAHHIPNLGDFVMKSSLGVTRNFPSFPEILSDSSWHIIAIDLPAADQRIL